MRSAAAITVLLVSAAIIAVLDVRQVRAAKRPSSRSSSSGAARVPSGSSSRGTGGRAPPASSRRRTVVYEEEDEYDEDGVGYEEDEVDEFVVVEEEDEEEFQPRARGPPSSRRPPGSSRTARDTAIRSSSRGRKRPPPGREPYDDFEEDEYDVRRPAGRGRPPSGRGPASRRGPPPGGRGSSRPPGGRVVPYARGGPQAPSTFTRGLSAIRSTMPDPAAVKNAALSSIKAARETTSGLSANLYREIKGLTSSELEQVMLKATRPDDTPVKGKHVERLVGVTYQISARYDIYDAVLRKLWAKMSEKDWRTTIKALYILHRFSADGAPDHAPSLKARLRELRRTRDPKRKDKYFNSKQLLAGEATLENAKYRAFLSRYAHYVLLRAQCFGGMFDEISSLPKVDKKKAPKPITSTSLRTEHLDAAAMLLKAGVACQLKDGEECENTAIAAERVAADLIGLTTAVAIALNRALKDGAMKGADPVLLKKWCEFYKDDLLPQTRAMVKRTSPKLDAYGLFLPSRMGTTVSPDLLERGLNLDGEAEAEDISSKAIEEESSSKASEAEDEEELEEEAESGKRPAAAAVAAEEEEAVEEEAQFDEEYEYDEEEYYDDEEEL